MNKYTIILREFFTALLRAKYTLTIEPEKTSWLETTTSLYECFNDNIGEQRTFRQIFFGNTLDKKHKHYFKNDKNKWVTRFSIDRNTIDKIRSGELNKQEGKKRLQCHTVSALFKTKKKDAEIIVHCNSIMQIDIDKKENPILFESEDSIQKVKAEIFKLPFVALVCKSVSGNGIFVLILISEPERLEEYAEHCFQVFRYYGLNPDTTKGKKYSNLRFVSYDENMLVREFPEPLKIKNFYKPPIKEYKPIYTHSPTKLIDRAMKEIAAAEVGNRSNVVNKWSWILGNHGSGLDEVIDAINNADQFSGEERYFIDIAKYAFNRGSKSITEDFKSTAL